MARIDYQTLLDNALKSVVKDALVHAQFNGLGDGAHMVSRYYDDCITVFVQ